MKLLALVLSAFITCFVIFGCANKASDSNDGTDISETAQQIGDVMVSIDEAGLASGAIANLDKSIINTFARYEPDSAPTKLQILKAIQPEAQATTCSGNGFAACGAGSAGVVQRTFGGCTVGTAIFTGNVLMTWAGSAANSCQLTTNGDTMTRVPNFTVTGRRSATLTVTKTGSYGQRLTMTGGGSGITRQFNFDSDGINRKFTSSSSTVLFNQTTTATSIGVIGTTRTNRVLSSGSLQVTNALTSINCTYIPTSVTWTNTLCNCPTSGSWVGSCSNGKTSTLTINGCGTGNYAEGTTTSPVTFDRCGT